jgi:hypothetical protein
MKRNKQSEASMKMRFLRLLFGCTFAMLACISIALGQTVTGSVTGVVTDPSGAVVTGAQVVAHNLDTGIDSPATTNSTGLFRIDFLPIGHYQVSVQANGFETATVPAFNLEVLQTANFNVKLTVGSSSTTVNVSAAAPILNTDNPTLDSTFTANTIGNLPLNGLDFSAVSLYVPGSVNTGGPAAMSNIARNTPNGGFAATGDTPNINGNRAQANNYTLNGIDMNESQDNWMAFSPAPEALEEIKVITANSPTDFGNANGAGVVLMLKSGTNQFHGSVYGYVQDYRFNANSWYNNYENSINNNNIAANTPYSQAQFGGTFGGPLLHDKLFFFVDYLGTRHHTGGISFASVMTADMRDGNFSAAGRNLYDTQNGFTPYAGNKGLPIVNPVAKYLFAHPQYYPLPNATPTDNVAANNYEADSRSYTNNNQGDMKVDYQLRPSDKISAFTSTGTVVQGSKSVLITDFPGENDFPTTLGGVDWAHTFSPSLVNLARIGFTRSNLSYSVPVDPTGAFGTKGDSVLGIAYTDQTVAGFTRQNLNFGFNGVGTSSGPSINIENAFSYIDNLTWQHGLHFFTMGIQAIRYQQNYTTNNNNGGLLGNISYNGSFTASGDPDTESDTGYGPADFVLDRVSGVGATLSDINVGQRQWRTAGYANDDFKIRPNLTLNLGLRYEFDQPWVESSNKTGNIIVNASDPNFGQPIYAKSVPAGAEPGSGICKNRACYQPNYRQIMPHLGFAYQAADRWVVRGGYGATSFFEGYSYNQRLTSLTPFLVSTSVNLTAPVPGAVTTPRTAEQGFSGTTSAYGGTYNSYPQNVQPAYSQNWSLTLEYALTRTTSLQAGYVGGKGDHLADYNNVNQDLVNGDPTSAPLYNNKYIGNNAPSSYNIYNTNNGILLITESRAMMNNNALQAVLRQRASHGVEFTVNYTYGKSMTNSLGDYSLNVNGFSGAFQNYYDSKADYGPSGSDIRHNLTGLGVFTVPVGRGQEYLHGINRWMDEAVGGWKIGTDIVAYSGFAESVSANQGNNSRSYGNSRPNQYRKLKIVHRSLTNWYGTDPSAQPCTTPGVDNGTCAFGETAPIFAADGVTVQGYKFGTASNGSLRGPGLLNMDVSAFKDFHIFGEHSVGFRFDAFNALNIASYGNPDSTFDDTRVDSNKNTVNKFGYNIQGTRSTARNMQFSAHYRF